MTEKTVEIKKQPRLGLGKTLSLTINGIKYRFFRSTVTMIVITVAIAFMMNSLSESIIKRNVSVESRHQIADTRLATTWASRLSVTGSIEDILLFCSKDFEKGEPKFEETKAFTGSDDAKMVAFGKQAVVAQRYLSWFNELKYEDRRRLVHQAEGIEIFERLRDANHFEKFQVALKDMRWLRFVDEDFSNFQEFLKQWPEVKTVADSVLAGRLAAINKLKPAYDGQTLTQALQKADGEFGKRIEDAGFRLSPETAKRIAFLAKRSTLQRFLEKRVVKMDVRKEVAKRYDVLPKDVSAIMLWDRLLVSKKDAEWTLRVLKNQWLLEEGLRNDSFKEALALKLGTTGDKVSVKAGLAAAMKDDSFANWLESQPQSQSGVSSFTITAEEAMAMAEARERLEKYIKAERQCADVREDSFLGMGKRMTWLLLVSLVVCIVGIANAMLMTVTERFREIATLKCLGALDGFIMLMFVIEATILGIFGGFFGSIVGGIIGVGRMRVTFGDILWESFSLGDMLFACLIAMLMGVVMAALAAIYPSLQASRMAPMEAMRID